jgi:hypothetical protein
MSYFDRYAAPFARQQSAPVEGRPAWAIDKTGFTHVGAGDEGGLLPPPMPQMTLAEQYYNPAFPPVYGGNGVLATDPAGRELVAETILGRRTANGEILPLTIEEWFGLGETLTGQPVTFVPLEELPGGAIGTTGVDGGRPTHIHIWEGLQDNPDLLSVLAHEVSHAIFLALGLAGPELVAANLDDFTTLYDGVNEAEDLLAPEHFVTPSEWGYREMHFDDEYFAEMLRTLGMQPTWVRARFPGLLDNIMAVINSDPDLRQWFQINARSDGPLDWQETFA